MLELRAVTKKYHAFPAVDNVGFVVKPGESVGYLGPNGAGKSTTLKMLAGFLKPTEGEILYKGRNIWKNLVWFKERMGYVPEDQAVYLHLSARDYLMMIARLRGIREKAAQAKIERFMRVFGLSGDMNAEMSTYSKGMVQKVLLSSALLHDPEVLLLDEPLTGLDVTTAMTIREVVREMAAAGKIIIYSSHILEIVEKVSSRVIILHKGRVAADDSVENLSRLMSLPSLGEIFSRLVSQEDPRAAALELIDAAKR
ncbi:MAG: ABC transporter ATP-binding protein [Acidobacteriota bacterium]|nr:ABC transporter ATP-binding protein [Acidobacteriota bacterium]